MLTDKEKRFCQEYIIDFNGSRAARDAGYSENTAAEIAYENLRKPHIKQYMGELLKPKCDKLDITVESVLKDIQEIKDRCMQKIPVTIYNKETKEYEETGEWKFDPNAALKATEQLGKYLAMFTDKIEHKGTIASIDPKDIDNILNGS